MSITAAKQAIEEASILRHALGINERTKRTSWGYRNFFTTGPGAADYATCNALVERGLMEVGRLVSWCPDVTFRVTRAGMLAAGLTEKEADRAINAR